MKKRAFLVAAIMLFCCMASLSAHAVDASNLQVSPYKESDFDGTDAELRLGMPGVQLQEWMTVTYHIFTKNPVTFNRNDCALEVKLDGTWYNVPQLDYTYGGGDRQMPAKGSRREWLYLSRYDYEFHTGDYRFILRIDEKPYKLEFQITDAVDTTKPFPSPYREEDFSQDVTIATEHTVYAKDIDLIYITIQNNTDAKIEFGDDYLIEKREGDAWRTLPFRDDVAFNSILNVMQRQGTFSESVWLGAFNHTYTDGVYRVIKEISDKVYYGVFEIGESPITAATPYGYDDLADLPKNYDVETAKADGCVVITDDGTFNEEKLSQFVDKALLGIPTMVRTLRAYGATPAIVDFIYESSAINSVKRFEVRRASAANPGAYKRGYYRYLTTITRNGKEMICFNHYAVPDRDAPRNSAYMLLNPKGCPQEDIARVKARAAVTRDGSYYARISPNGQSSASLSNYADTDRKRFGYSTPGMGARVDVPLPKLKRLTSLKWLDNARIELTGEYENGSKFTIVYHTTKEDFE